jgi:hypothetical protein
MLSTLRRAPRISLITTRTNHLYVVLAGGSETRDAAPGSAPEHTKLFCVLLNLIGIVLLDGMGGRERG